MRLSTRCEHFNAVHAEIASQGINPYFRPIAKTWGSEVQVAGKRLEMIGSNDYLGLSHDPRVMDASAKAIYAWGTGPRLPFLKRQHGPAPAFGGASGRVRGQEGSVVHVTGFSTNLGALGCLITPADTVLCDRESHASIFEGIKSTRARISTFAHNDAANAAKKNRRGQQTRPEGDIFLITEGVFQHVRRRGRVRRTGPAQGPVPGDHHLSRPTPPAWASWAPEDGHGLHFDAAPART
jgi:glycine C-acetyltransferase